MYQRLDTDVIERAQTKITSLIVPVLKGDSAVGFYANFSRLNAIRVRNQNAAPQTEGLIDQLGTINIFME